MDRSIFLTPSRCPVPSKCRRLQHEGGFLSSQKACSLGSAENYWQSSTWPIRLLYLSTMYYKAVCRKFASTIFEFLIFMRLLYHKCENHFIFFAAIRFRP